MKLALFAILITSSAVGQTADTWTQLSPSHAPPPRYGAAMAYDSTRHQVVLFGGEGPVTNVYGPVPNLNDTWTWDGTTWTQRLPQSSPPARSGHSMAFDSDRGVVVLFGGFTAGVENGGFLNDTWTWDGTNWAQQAQQAIYAAPPPRSGAQMAYDSIHHQTVMFSGQGQGVLKVLNDTWLWDGSSWTNVIPPNPPFARLGASMVFDAANGMIVLFGGNIIQAFANDTWLWDGSNWTQENPQTAVRHREPWLRWPTIPSTIRRYCSEELKASSPMVKFKHRWRTIPGFGTVPIGPNSTPGSPPGRTIACHRFRLHA